MNIIGISGPARSGKDTLADSISQILTESKILCKRYSFANELKKETRDFLLRTVGIDSFTEKTHEKNIIRPFLVAWSTHVRRKLDPNIWIDKVKNQISDNEVAIISDVRFQNELDWLRSEESYHIFVDRVENGIMIPPANEEESVENEFLRKSCDYYLCWDTVGESKKEILLPIAYGALESTIDKNQIIKWKQTCPLS